MLRSRLRGAVGIVAIVGGIAGVLAAQTPARPTFDVASITVIGRGRPQPQDGPPFDPRRVMQGRVVADDTGLPLPHAHVTVGGGARPAVLTDADGRFELPGTSPDRPVVSASKVGYMTTRAALTEGLAVRLPRSAVITGWVVDDHGSPLPNMAVVAEGRVLKNGRLESEPRAMMVTDDLGAYRLFGLPAGDYVIGLAGLTVPSATVCVRRPPCGQPNGLRWALRFGRSMARPDQCRGSVPWSARRGTRGRGFDFHRPFRTALA